MVCTVVHSQLQYMVALKWSLCHVVSDISNGGLYRDLLLPWILRVFIETLYRRITRKFVA